MPSLADLIPERAAYMQAREFGQKQDMGQLQQMGALQQIAQRQQAMQQDQELRAMLAQSSAASGGDPAKTVQILMQSGNPKAIELATHLKGLMPKPTEPYTLGPEQVRYGPNGEILAVGIGKDPKTQNPSDLSRLIAERDARKAANPNDPNIAAFDNAIRKQSETARQIVPPIVVNAGGPKAPVGFRFNEAGDSLEPIPGGPKDPNVKVQLSGGRESVYVQRMMMGANQAAKDLNNVVQLPLSASTGLFGGRKQGPGLFDATKEILANKATSQEAQAYNAMATGFQRSLAQIESAGLMPSGSLTHQMDAVLFKEGDTNLTKMHKLAQTRQIVEAGLEVIEANPRVSPEEKAKVKTVLESIRKSVPFTHSDLIQLQVAQYSNPNATLKDVVGARPKWEVVR